MPLIGDELRTILGMMPVRDRAGIARGTMADDAARAEAAVRQRQRRGSGADEQGCPAARSSCRPWAGQVRLT